MATPTPTPQQNLNALPPDVATTLAKTSTLARQNLDLSLAHLPEEMKQLPHWIVWTCAVRQNKSGEWPLTKEPHIAQLDKPQHAASTRPEEWRSLNVALTVLKQDWARKHGGFYDGLGFTLQDSGLTGIDLDNVINDDGNIKPWAELLLKELRHTYAEVSVRGRGLHIIVRGTFKGAGIEQKFSDGSAFEMYCQGRYFTVTGQRWDNAPSVIAICDCQALYDRFHNGFVGPTDFRKQQSENARKTKKALKHNGNGKGNGQAFDVAGFIQRNGIAIVSGPKTDSDGATVWEIECGGSHEGYDRNDGKAFVRQHASGAISAGCQHKEHCSWGDGENHWDELREHYEPRGRIRKLTDYGNGERLVDDHSHEMRWSKQFTDWLVWDDECWTRDHKLQPERWAQHRARHINHEATPITTKQSEIQTQLGESESEEQDGDIRPN